MANVGFTLDESLVAELRTSIEGEVLTPEEAGYEDARTVWNGAVDRHPAVIVRVASTEDVVEGLAAAREHGVPVSVRAGGHHVTGSALVDDGLVLDVSEMNEVVIDPEERTATVGPGARVSDVLNPAQAHGLAPVVGSAAQTGVSGSTLAGGIGWIRRMAGLGIDTLRSAEVVTGAGEVLTVDETHHPELFWAIRGGGAQVGVTTRFELELIPVGPEVAIAQTMYPLEAADEILSAYRAYAAEAPDEVTTLVVLMRVPPLPDIPEEAVGVPIVMVFGVYAGDVAEGEAAMAPLRELGEPLMDMSGPQPLASVHEVARLLFPDGRRYSWHSLYATELDDDLITDMADALMASPSPESELTIYQLGGAIADVPSEATAFGFRDASYLLSVGAAWEDPAKDEETVGWAKAQWEMLREKDATIEGFYAGFPGFVEGEERARMIYGENLERLLEVKAEYDPDGLLGNPSLSVVD